MRYYPYLSIPENAKRNNCSEAAVRKYIRVNGIDRRFERKATIVNEIRKVIRKDSSLTLSEIAKATRHSVNTIKTYYPFATKEIPLSKSDTVKVSKTDIRQLNNYYVARPSVIFVHFWTKVGGMELALSSFIKEHVSNAGVKLYR